MRAIESRDLFPAQESLINAGERDGTHGRAGVTRSGDASSSDIFNSTLRPAVLAYASGEANGLIQPGFVRRAEITPEDQHRQVLCFILRKLFLAR
jgi:hypothetical protein